MARDSLDQLLSRLNISATTAKDTALYEVIKELIKKVKELSLNSGSSSSVINNITQIQQFSDVFGGDSGGDGDIGPPGIRGVDGVAGATGAQGPPFPAFIYLEPEEAEVPQPIPGNTGNTGPTGATGPTGPNYPAFIYLEPEEPEIPNPIPGPAGTNGTNGSAGWTLIDTRTCTGNAQEDFPNLSAYSEILILTIGITKSANGLTSIRVSTDNGATFLSTSGDYLILAGTGITTNDTLASLHITTASAARTAVAIIRAFNKTTPKWLNSSSSSTINYIIPTTTALNALRVLSSVAGNLTGGTIYLYGR